MEKDKLITNTKKRIEEIDFELKRIQNDMDDHKGEPMTEQQRSALKQLHTLRDELHAQYNNLISSTADSAQNDLDKMEKNIYNSLESYNNAFTQAGSIFTRRFERPK